jgi:lipopolysaccharide/colanic/teichoic acid biosynthesis glycosyltransferase
LLGQIAKRAFDVVVAGTTLCVTAPLLGVLAAAVKLETPGPALFEQTRVGRGRRPIRIFKLRTMVMNATGMAITAGGDPRITRVGALLRKTKLDELPQLWNVLRGDMSIVGPRPEVERYVKRYRPEWDKLFSVRPGITDLASLVFRDEERVLALAHDRERAYTEVVMPIKLELALAGIERSSLLEDLRVIARTALSIVRPDGVDPVLSEVRRRIEQLNRGES